MTTARKLYNELTLCNQHGRDVAYLANVILVGASKPTTKLANLLAAVKRGSDVRVGNLYGFAFVDGAHVSLSHFDKG